MPATTYVFEPGSLADRCLQLLAINAEDDFAPADLASKFDTSSGHVSVAMRLPVAQGLATYLRNTKEGGIKCYQATPLLLQLLKKTPTTLVTSAAPAPRTGKRARTPLPELDKLQIRHDVPVPPPGRGDLGKKSVYAEIWERMKPGSSVVLPDRQALALMAYVKKHKQQAVVRKLDPGTRGVWRQA